jgi:hypothetical protein
MKLCTTHDWNVPDKPGKLCAPAPLMHLIRSRLVAQSYSSMVWVRGSPDSQYKVQIAKKIFEFNLPAPEELALLANPFQEENEVALTIQLGCHDVATSDDSGNTWDAATRCASLDVLTIVSVWKDGGGKDTIQRVERSNYMYPVLDDQYDRESYDNIPQSDYFHPHNVMHRIEDFHCSLNTLDQFVAGPRIAP